MLKPKAPKLVTVAIFTTITVVFWVFMSLYNIITSKPPANVEPELLKPINPTLDQEALNRLEGRVFFEQGETSSPLIMYESPKPTPETESASQPIPEVENPTEQGESPTPSE